MPFNFQRTPLFQATKASLSCLEGGILTAHGASEFQRIEVRLVVFSEETVSSEVQTKSSFSTSHGALDLKGHDNMPFAVC